MNVLTQALTHKEIKRRMDEDKYIKGVVAVELSEIIDNDFEGFLDILSERLLHSANLMDINYSVVGHADDSTLHILVSGDVSEAIEEEE